MTTANLLGALDGPDLLIILAIVMVLFGGAKLPQLARSLGEAKQEFHKATNGEVPAHTPTTAPQTSSSTTSEDKVLVDRRELEELRRTAAGGREAGG